MRWIKRLFLLALIAGLGLGFWVAFGLWAGIYSVYSYPPGPDHPHGATLLVERDEKEPTFNSPDVKLPPPPPRERSSGLGFTTATRKARPLEGRTLVELPYIEWAYKKSLEP